MDDSKTNLLLWNIRIPIQLVFPSLQTPPLFELIPRSHYISLYYNEINEYYNTFNDNNVIINDLWLEYNGIPVIWNIPFGVFYDLYVKDKGVIVEIKAKYGQIDQKLLKRSFNEKQWYFWDLKQASCIKFENDGSNILMSLPAKKYDLLWDNFEKNNRIEFIEIFKGCWDPLINNKDKRKTYKVLPVRIYLYINKIKIQRGILIEKGEENKGIGDALKEIFPDIKEFQIISNGVKIALNTTLMFLYENFFYYDGFVYLIVKT